VGIRPDTISVSELEHRLRHHHTPIIIRIHDGKALISPRTLLPGDEEKLLMAIEAIRG